MSETSNSPSSQSNPVFRFNGQKIAQEENIPIKSHDFTHPSFISESQKRFIKQKNEKFSTYLASTLSSFLRTEFKITPKELEIAPFSKIREKIASPTHLALFKLNLGKTIGLLNLDLPISLSIINRMLGGKGTSSATNRSLTNIELGLIDEVLHIILKEFIDAWKDTIDFSFEILGKDNDLKFLSVIEKNTPIILLELETQLGDAKGSFHFIIPSLMFEPFSKKINSAIQKYSPLSTEQKNLRWSDAYSEISVPLFADLDLPGLAVKDFLKWRVGDVLQVPKEALSSTKIRVMNKTSFSGELGADDGKLAIKVKSQFLQ